MYKEELIYLHQLLLYLSKFLMDNGAPKSYFEEYKKLNISPHHIHKRKVEHRYAVFVLSKCISDVLVKHGAVPQGIADKMEFMVQRCVEEMR